MISLSFHFLLVHVILTNSLCKEEFRCLSCLAASQDDDVRSCKRRKTGGSIDDPSFPDINLPTSILSRVFSLLSETRDIVECSKVCG